MTLKKIVSVALVTVMVLSFGMVVNAAETVTLNAATSDAAGGRALNLVNGDVALYILTTDVTHAVTAFCPSWSDNLGTINFFLYRWEGDYSSSVQGEILHTKEVSNVADNSMVEFDYPSAPAGEYLMVWKTAGSNSVGLYHAPDASEAAKAAGFEQKLYYSAATTGGVLRGSITKGYHPTLGSIKKTSASGEEIDIGEDKNSSNVPKGTVEERLSKCVAMYTGSPLAVVNGKTRVIDKFNQRVVPVVQNGHTMVPIRFIAENFGMELTWDELTQTTTLKKGTNEVQIKVGSNYMIVNGEVQNLDVAPVIMNNRITVSIDSMSMALGVPVCRRKDGNNDLIVIGDICKDVAEDDDTAGTLLIIFKEL